MKMRPDADDDADWTTAGDFGVGSTVGPYRLVRRIGRGGMGLVFEGVHVDLQKRVAIKTLHARVDGSVARERFLREGRAAARVQHPNAVEIFDTGVQGGVAWLAMEYLAGEDLGSVLDREGRLEVTRLTDLMLPVIAAVAAAHAQGIVHRDLKPENIFLAEVHVGMLQPKVLDFGVARLLDENNSLTRSAVLLGTPFYMSPEQAINSRNASLLSDQYSLGVVLFECATGRLPFEQESLFELLEAIVRGPYATPRDLRPEIPVAFEDVVLRALERTPTRRFDSLHALGAALLPFASPAVRATWQPVFAVEVRCHTLRTSVVPPPGPAAPLPPKARDVETLDTPAPHVIDIPPTPWPAPSDRTPAVPSRASAARPRLIAAALIALSVLLAFVLSSPPPPPASVAALAPSPVPPVAAAPVVPVIAPPAPVVVAPVAPPPTPPEPRRVASATPAVRASGRRPQALHHHRANGVLILH